MTFEFATARQILFGPGTARRIAEGLDPGTRCLWITGAQPDRVAHLRTAVEKHGVECVPLRVTGEPSVEFVKQSCGVAQRCTHVVAVGGGSVLDAAKAIAALAQQPNDALEYLEVVGLGRPLDRPPLPLTAVPTTSGTGSEVTRNAVLTVPERRVKVSLRDPAMLPARAIVDPELALELPVALTATTGLDALTQLLEAFVSLRANPWTDALCREGLRRVGRALPRAVADGRDVDARSEMALGALWSGVALANAGLGAVHGLAGPLGGRFGTAHGALCAALLVPVWRENVSALAAASADHPALARYREAAQQLTGRAAADIPDGERWLRELIASLPVPRLRDLSVAADEFSDVAAQAAKSSSMKGNPVALGPESLVRVLEEAW
jgi:alcohol dehydrogenase class IV